MYCSNLKLYNITKYTRPVNQPGYTRRNTFEYLFPICSVSIGTLFLLRGRHMTHNHRNNEIALDKLHALCAGYTQNKLDINYELESIRACLINKINNIAEISEEDDVKAISEIDNIIISFNTLCYSTNNTALLIEHKHLVNYKIFTACKNMSRETLGSTNE
jgi:predicted membrane protein